MFTFLFFRLCQINVTKMRAARAARTFSIIVFAVFISFLFFPFFFGIARIYLRFQRRKKNVLKVAYADRVVSLVHLFLLLLIKSFVFRDRVLSV